jgi:hypothetical protein
LIIQEAADGNTNPPTVTYALDGITIFEYGRSTMAGILSRST